MANNIEKMSARQLDILQNKREEIIYKSNKMMQKSRYELTLTEQRIILHAISKIKRGDTYDTSYIIDLNELYSICGINNDSYTEIKRIMTGLNNRCWWLSMEDPDEPGTECESLVRWFNIVRTNKKTGKVRVKFHEDMHPFIFELMRRYEEFGTHYSQYALNMVLPMKSQYSIRLYELLKSYQVNNHEWWFKVTDLKKYLNCVEKFKLYGDFKRRVINPAVKEINQFTDLNITYEEEKEGKRIDVINFSMLEKKQNELFTALHEGQFTLNGF